MPGNLLIAGCGYLGRQLALLARGEGWEVACLTRSPESAEALTTEGLRTAVCDISSASSVRSAATQLGCADPLIAHCAASGRGGRADAYRQVYLDGCRHLLESFPEAARFFFTSSSSVYAQIDGAVVTENSPALPDRETGIILRETEDMVLASGIGVAGRLAGIYGPNRSVLLRQFLAGESKIDVRTEPPATPDGRWINQIHRDDAARAILHLLILPAGAVIGRIFNVADSTPLLQRPLYAELARRFGKPLPPEAPPDTTRKRGWTHKRVDNSRLRASGWAPQFPSWLDAVDHDERLVSSILEIMSEHRGPL